MNLIYPYLRYRFPALWVACFILFPTIIIAQPGWRDLSRHYEVKITDENGKPILFSGNRSYQIIVDDKVFSAGNIQKDSLTPVPYLSDTFYNYVRINDFSYKTVADLEKLLSLKIVHGRDTMCLGNGRRLVLKFSEGHFYFPDWAGDLLGKDGLFNNQEITIVNRDQSLFRVSQKTFEEYLSGRPTIYEQSRTIYDEVIQNFIDATLSAKQTVENLKVINPMKGYDRSGGWEEEKYAAPDSNRFLGMTEYVYQYPQSNHTVYMNVFSVFDKALNKVTLWKPTDNPLAFYHSTLLFDKWNKKFYLYSGTRNLDGVVNPLDFVRYPFTTTIYESSNYGKTWSKSPRFQQLYDKSKVEKIFFLDKEYAVVMKSKEIMSPRNYRIKQGTFLLTRNFRIVDSLTSPDEVHYDYNSCCFKAEQINDKVVNLGRWGFNDQNIWQPYSQPRLIKKDNHWFFEIVKDSLKRIHEYTSTNEEYRNFTLVNRRTFKFKNGSSFSTDREIINVLEREDIICIMHSYFVLLSFNAGRTWHLYPKALNTYGRYFLPEITRNGEISFYDMRDLKKYVYSFKEK